MQPVCRVYIGAGSRSFGTSKIKALGKVFNPDKIKNTISNQFSKFQKQTPANIKALDWSQWVESVNVNQSDQKVSEATIVLKDPYLAFFDHFVPGEFVQVDLGWNKRGELGKVFKGLVHKVSFTLKADGATITLTCLADEINLISSIDNISGSSYSSSGMGVDTDAMENNIESSEDGVGDLNTPPSLNDVEDKLKHIAEKFNLKLQRPINVRVKAQSNRVSQNIGTNQKTYLAQLYELAEDHYAVWYIDDEKLFFKDLVSFVRERKPSYSFIFNSADDKKTALQSLFGAFNTGNLIEDGNETFLSDRGNGQFLVDSVTLIEGRSIKEFTPKFNEFNYDLKSGTITVYGEKGQEPKQYRLNSAKLDKLERDDPQKADEFIQNLPREGFLNKNRWNEIKQYFDEVIVTDLAPTDRTKDDKVERAKPPIDFFGSGAKVTLPFGSWKIKAIDNARLLGVSHYSDNYYVAEVQHKWSRDKYECEATLLRVFDVGKFMSDSGLNNFSLRTPF